MCDNLLMSNFIDELKAKRKITRDDIEQLLASIGKPGENHQEKIDAVKELNKANNQGIKLEDTLESFRGF